MFTVQYCSLCTVYRAVHLCYNANSGKGRRETRRPKIGVGITFRYTPVTGKEVESMAVSDSKKKANLKWDNANMATLACKVKKEQAEKFKAYCASTGDTVNSVLQDYVTECLAGDGGKRSQNSVESHGSSSTILAPDALKIAQEAAQRAGEDIPTFVTRAVTNQNQRDKIGIALKSSVKEKEG